MNNAYMKEKLTKKDIQAQSLDAEYVYTSQWYITGPLVVYHLNFLIRR